MDYDDLVDQFIVNDSNDRENSADSVTEIHSENGKSNSDNSIKEELLKIHLKNLIQSRQLSRQTVQLERVKERNKNYQKMTISTQNGATSVNNFANNERRRKILDEIDKVDKVESVNEGNAKIPTNSELIPCRLELDHEGYKISDVFLLPSDPAPSQSILEVISGQLCQDYDLPVEMFQMAVTRCLKDQVEEWHVYQGALEGMKIPYEEIGPVPMRLDIIVGLHRLEDKLEVSLDPSDSNTKTMSRFVSALKSPDESILPEKEYAAFKPLILHNLLEQLMLWRKAIVFGGFHRDPRSNNLKFHDGDVAVLLNDPPTKSVSSVRRHFADTNTFTPILSVLTVEELDKIEAGRERESRRRRRTGAVGNVTTASASGNASTTIPGKRTTSATATTINSSIQNNLTGTVRSPPRTLPTPTSYRGSLHRIQLTAANSDDEGTSVGPRKRGRKAKNAMGY